MLYPRDDLKALVYRIVCDNGLMQLVARGPLLQ